MKWYEYASSYTTNYVQGLSEGFLAQLENTNTIEACGILLDRYGNVLMVFLLFMGWSGKAYNYEETDEAINKVFACYGTYTSEG